MERQLEMSIESQKRVMDKFKTFVDELLKKLESEETTCSESNND